MALPEETHATRRRMAETERGSSRRQPTAEPGRLAERPATDELMDRIDDRSGGRVSFKQAARDLAEDRR